MVNRQFYIYKFESKYLEKNKYNIKLNFKQAKENEQIIAVSDSQMLRSIRDIQQRYVDKYKIELLFKKRDDIKKLPSSKVNSSLIREINKQINMMMFVPEYVSVIISKPAHYKKLFYNGLYINGKKYIRFSCSASQARVNTIIMVQEDISEELYKRLNNGRHSKKLNPSKFNAYLGLSSSATTPVSTPRVCVVSDCLMKRNTLVNYVTEVYEPLCDDIIERKEVEIEYNYFDGMGLISPQQSEKWAHELELDWIPAEWCIRNAWIKGMVCTFPIQEFCEKVNGGNYMIETIYKNEDGSPKMADLRNIDVIISESQFKMAGCYDSYEEYERNCITNKLSWGISKYSPKQDSNNLYLNYQSLQTLKLDDEDIIELCKPTVDWIRGVTRDNVMYTSLFLMGKSVGKNGVINFVNSSDNYWLKSLLVNHDVIKDRYVSDKIYDNIVNKIKSACMGKLVVNGNYQCLVSDPYAMMEHICGLEPNGLLKENEYYSKYWNDRGVSLVDSMRSPLTYRSEHNLLDLKDNEGLSHWYRYLNTGIVVNVHGDDVLRWADSDYDFDILATTSNKTIIKGVYKDELAVTYQKKTTDKIDFTQEDLYKADLLAFGSDIGAITNKSTSMYAMLPLYEPNSPQYKELERRLIMTRVAQGNSIDKAKGVQTKPFPKHWGNYQRQSEEDTDEVKQKKEFFNSILVEKKPYFFKYLYKDSRVAYNKFLREEESYRQIYGIDLSSIQHKDESKLTEKEKYYLASMNYRNPLIESDCEMNRICRYLESVDFDIKHPKEHHEDIYNLYMYDGIEKNINTYNSVKRSVKSFFQSLREDISMSDYSTSLKYVPDEEHKIINKYDLFKDTMTDLCSNINELVNYLVEIFYVDMRSCNKDILWKTFGKTMFTNVYNKSSKKVFIPQIEDDGEYTYLFDRYNVLEVDLVG